MNEKSQQLNNQLALLGIRMQDLKDNSEAVRKFVSFHEQAQLIADHLQSLQPVEVTETTTE